MSGLMPLGVLPRRRTAAIGVDRITDDFERGESGDPIGGPWRALTASEGDWRISVSGGNGRGEQWLNSGAVVKAILTEEALSTPDHSIEADIIATNSIGAVRGLLVRANDADAVADLTGYYADVRTGALGRVIGGVVTPIQAGGLPVVHGVHRFEVEGDQLRLYRDGTLVAAVTDTAITQGRRTGLITVRNMVFDDVTAQVLGSPPSP